MRALAYIACTLLLTPLIGQTAYTVHVLAIGNGRYIKDPGHLQKGFAGLVDNADAEESAARFAATMSDHGAIRVDTLISRERHFLSRENVLGSVADWTRTVQAAKAINPLLVFYYCGHGFSEGTNYSLFLPPGDLTRDPRKLNAEEWGEVAISPLDIREKMEATGLPYLILLDCCYEGRQKPDPEMPDQYLIDQTGSQAAMDLWSDMIPILKMLNLMRGPDPVLFATRPGKVVETLLHRFEDGETWVGPLCARSQAVLRAAQLAGTALTLQEYVERMVGSSNQVPGGAAFTDWVADERNGNFILKP